MALGIHETVFKFKRETLPIRMASKHVRSFSYPISPGNHIDVLWSLSVLLEGSDYVDVGLYSIFLLLLLLSGFYRRVLPSPPAIEFGSSEGKKLFAEAYEAGHMEGYFKLSPCYQTQSEPAYCGLASLSMVLNALGIDPGRKWKGPWRWFDEHMLDCCESLEKIKSEGISFGKLACLAYYNGAKVGAFRTNQSTITDFHKYVMTCTSSEDCHVITSFYRPHLKLVITYAHLCKSINCIFCLVLNISLEDNLWIGRQILFSKYPGWTIIDNI
ncbi:PREDICTED: glutathione gamma-glutamylcysteinyltransferase 2-like [Nelumbo nucifera]|uniref:glutathione gamma-glutamylcysteinyltransferase n=1 Tax=Nelumbo nucifera TaxID=4432 RepID=A0A1U8Q9J9_NELNU|nr:PREDICTED: glutathione gamma-glutamylcysteinyltransferase 2-like [Nelumbo nucifera]